MIWPSLSSSGAVKFARGISGPEHRKRHASGCVVSNDVASSGMPGGGGICAGPVTGTAVGAETEANEASEGSWDRGAAAGSTGAPGTSLRRWRFIGIASVNSQGTGDLRLLPALMAGRVDVRGAWPCNGDAGGGPSSSSSSLTTYTGCSWPLMISWTHIRGRGCDGAEGGGWFSMTSDEEATGYEDACISDEGME